MSKWRENDDNAHIMASALESFCGDVDEVEEWQEAFRVMAINWGDDKELGRGLHAAWLDILSRDDDTLFKNLVSNCANQGDCSAEEAKGLLQEWYDHLQPLWDSLKSDEPAGEIVFAH